MTAWPVSKWDEAWYCPACGTELAWGNGRRGGGNAIVKFTQAPRCYCGEEMEQGNVTLDPEDVEELFNEQ